MYAGSTARCSNCLMLRPSKHIYYILYISVELSRWHPQRHSYVFLACKHFLIFQVCSLTKVVAKYQIFIAVVLCKVQPAVKRAISVRHKQIKLPPFIKIFRTLLFTGLEVQVKVQIDCCYLLNVQPVNITFVLQPTINTICSASQPLRVSPINS